MKHILLCHLEFLYKALEGMFFKYWGWTFTFLFHQILLHQILFQQILFHQITLGIEADHKGTVETVGGGFGEVGLGLGSCGVGSIVEAR